MRAGLSVLCAALGPALFSALSACSAPPSDASGRDEDLVVPHAVAREASLTTPDVRIIVEPSDRGSGLITAIKGATHSVHVTMYLLSDADVMAALVERHQAGVDVRVILNQRFETSETNQPTFDQLTAAGIPVVWAPATFTFTHEKCVVIDAATAWIMTMNLARTSLIKNREYLAVDTTAADVAEAEAQFQADFAGQPFTPVGDLVMSPLTARSGITTLITEAQRTLDFEVEEMTDRNIVASLCDAATRHVVVRGVLPVATRTAAGAAAITQLKACGASLVALAHPYIHAKAIVVDGARTYVGSANLSPTSLGHNRELGVMTSNEAAVSTVATTVAADIAAGTAL
jgi:phosphatidylserine/phosphatidylglycerophosphate/cardiolipin synthase-like enzyme